MNATELDRVRPLELRVRVAEATPGFEGVSEREANRHARHAADAAVLLRTLFTEEGPVLHVLAVNGHNLDGGGALSVQALFHLWVSFTAFVARQTPDPEVPEDLAQIVFAQKVLGLMQLDPEMRPFTEPASSTPASPDSPSGDAATSTG